MPASLQQSMQFHGDVAGCARRAARAAPAQPAAIVGGGVEANCETISWM